MKFKFEATKPTQFNAPEADWLNWQWQMRASLKSQSDFARHLSLTQSEELGFATNFSVRCTPYYLSLAIGQSEHDPIRKIILPTSFESLPGVQEMLDPLGEKKNNPAPRVIHRYPDRALLLVTDTCSVYCRYCTRKHFTATDQAFIKSSQYDQALSYFKSQKSIREVILSGGDPLTLGDDQLERILSDLTAIEHIELIRIGTRMPVVCPMRITEDLVFKLKKYHPVFIMTHFNHPREVTYEASQALLRLVDNGFPVFNQMVLLNGVNNHPAIIQALSRRLLSLRTKPYYMFQCDPSFGSDHLRTSVADSLDIQRQLWGRLSGLAMPHLSLDIPNGGGKAGLTPNFETSCETDADGIETRKFTGWDQVSSEYVSPPKSKIKKPIDAEKYLQEWDRLSF
jgi:lysine 2,3-aminomutase